MSRVGAGLIAAALTLALSPAATAQSTPIASRSTHAVTASHAATAAQPGEQPQRVSLHIKMPNCKACKIKLQTVLNPQYDVWESRWHHVKDGEIRFNLTARHAQGATFLIRAKWADLYGYQPLVAFHYRGFDDGDPVSDDQAAKKKRGTACWVGGHGRESLTVRTGRFIGQTPPGDDATGIRAWVSHTQPKLGRYLYADHGAIGAQEVVSCGNR